MPDIDCVTLTEMQHENAALRATIQKLREKAQTYLDVVCDWIDVTDERQALEVVLARAALEKKND